MWRSALVLLLALASSSAGITWNFDADGDTQGWLAQDVPGGTAPATTHKPLQSVVSDGVWRIQGPAYAPQRTPTVGVLSPPLNLPSELFDRIEVRCRVVHTTPVTGQLLVVWTNEHNRWDAPQSNSYDYTFAFRDEAVYTGQWQEITLSPLVSGLGARPTPWEGNLEDIQLQLVMGAPAPGAGMAWGGGPGDVPEAVEIDWIRLTGVDEQLQGELDPPTFTADTPRGQLFAPATFYPVYSEQIAAVPGLHLTGGLGDVDGDGVPDLVLPWQCWRDDDRAYGWLAAPGRGDGSFGRATHVEESPGYRLAVADVDGDGRADVVASRSPDVAYLRNDPHEGWLVAQEFADRRFEGLADADLDGRPDLWLAETSGVDAEALWLLRNLGHGELGSPEAVGGEVFAAGSPVTWSDGSADVTRADLPYRLGESYALYLGDFDRDGDLDCVDAATQGMAQVPVCRGLRLLVNQADAGVDTLAWPQSVDVASRVDFVDLSADGRPDMVFVDSDVRQPAVVVALGVDEGLPIQEGRYPLSGRGGNVLTGDVDNDGDIDLVVYERSVNDEGGVHVLLSRLADGATAVAEESGAALPAGFRLGAVYPNPFNPEVVIPFTLAADVPRARLVVYNVLGQSVRTLVDGPLPAGEHRVVWDGRDDRGQPLPSGVYFHRLAAGGRVASGRCVRVE